MREKLETETTIKEFDRQVFESIVDYVIVGGYNEEGNADPSMITFVYRTGFKERKDVDHFKLERLNAAKKKTGSDSHTKEVYQSDDTSSNSSLSHSGLQSLIPDDSDILQSNTSPDACGDSRMSTKGGYVEILEFTHFARFLSFLDKAILDGKRRFLTRLKSRWLWNWYEWTQKSIVHN